ncbi:MAG: hypothetical protein M1819_002471 [Sarea resinae]|nr:MAG: hypothetical protein M1819_002471 [Sarea resinae]
MRSLNLAAAALLSVVSLSQCASDANITKPLSSRQILPSNFKPPQVFENVNLLRNINLEKSYPRETINVVIENKDAEPQDEYYLPFEAGTIDSVGGLEVRDKKDAGKGLFKVEVVEYDPSSSTQFYLIRLPEPLAPSAQQTLSITYSLLSSLSPIPAKISQMDKQFLRYTFSAYAPSAYSTKKQKTKVKFPTTDIPDYTVLPSTSSGEDPQRQGSTFTYGPYDSLPAGASELVTVRYEFTKPVLYVSLLERDLEISHWGGNLATEERYWLVNHAAELSSQFNRVAWQSTQYYNPPTAALRELNFPLRPGAQDPYFTDDIGNVSTSRWRSNSREAKLELKPRYPVFGGWKYSFRVGWNAELSRYLRRLSNGESYVLKVPVLEGPKQAEGIEYEKAVIRVILPEGATNINYETSLPITSAEKTLHKTFMDTLGRSTLTLTAANIVDEFRDRDLIVTYDYPFLAAFRKPLTITVGLFSVFVTVWALGKLDVSIGRKRKAVVS